MGIEDIDLDALIAKASNPDIGKNAYSITELLKEANNIINILDKSIETLNKLETNIIASTVVKLKAKSAGVDLAPLRQAAAGIIPQSETHRILLENINKMNPAQLQEMAVALQEHDRAKADKIKPGKSTD